MAKERQHPDQDPSEGARDIIEHQLKRQDENNEAQDSENREERLDPKDRSDR